MTEDFLEATPLLVIAYRDDTPLFLFIVCTAVASPRRASGARIALGHDATRIETFPGEEIAEQADRPPSGNPRWDVPR